MSINELGHWRAMSGLDLDATVLDGRSLKMYYKDNLSLLVHQAMRSTEETLPPGRVFCVRGVLTISGSGKIKAPNYDAFLYINYFG